MHLHECDPSGALAAHGCFPVMLHVGHCQPSASVTPLVDPRWSFHARESCYAWNRRATAPTPCSLHLSGQCRLKGLLRHHQGSETRQVPPTAVLIVSVLQLSAYFSLGRPSITIAAPASVRLSCSAGSTQSMLVTVITTAAVLPCLKRHSEQCWGCCMALLRYLTCSRAQLLSQIVTQAHALHARRRKRV